MLFLAYVVSVLSGLFGVGLLSMVIGIPGVLIGRIFTINITPPSAKTWKANLAIAIVEFPATILSILVLIWVNKYIFINFAGIGEYTIGPYLGFLLPVLLRLPYNYISYHEEREMRRQGLSTYPKTAQGDIRHVRLMMISGVYQQRASFWGTLIGLVLGWIIY